MTDMPRLTVPWRSLHGQLGFMFALTIGGREMTGGRCPVRLKDGRLRPGAGSVRARIAFAFVPHLAAAPVEGGHRFVADVKRAIGGQKMAGRRKRLAKQQMPQKSMRFPLDAWATSPVWRPRRPRLVVPRLEAG